MYTDDEKEWSGEGSDEEVIRYGGEQGRELFERVRGGVDDINEEPKTKKIRRVTNTPEEGYEPEEDDIRRYSEFKSKGIVDEGDGVVGPLGGGDILCNEVLLESNDEVDEEVHSGVRGSVGRECEQVDLARIVAIYKENFSTFRRKLIHSIVDASGIVGYSEMHARLLKTMSRRDVFISFYHEQGERSHWHIIHDCRWRNYSCGCFVFDVRPRVKRRCKSTTAPDASAFIIALLKYSVQGERYLNICKVGKSYWESSDRSKSLQVFGPTGSSVYGAMEEIVDYCEDGGERGGPAFPGKSKLVAKTQEIYGEQWSSRKILPHELSRFILTNLTYPLDNVMQCHAWRISMYQFVLPGDKTLMRALLHGRNLLTQYSFKDFHDLYTKADNIYMGALEKSIQEYYHSPEESLKIALKLLKYQFQKEADEINVNIKDYIAVFVKQLWDVMERKVPKKNTIYVVSPPSSGKNFFFDAVVSFYLNVGVIANFSKYNQFPLNDCPNRRVLYWNEPNFTESAIFTLKKLLGGDLLKVNIKFGGHQTIYKTPVVMLSNVDVLRDNSFLDRVYAYNWKAAPFLKKYKKKLHPFLWPLLIKKYITNQDIEWNIDNGKLDKTFYCAAQSVLPSDMVNEYV